ncbi:MAG TPA: alpha/beta hydrolase, partial [Firmicutes bacterium]|nr:alpha/beta hydrolase [Bacillota bacterium]
MGFYVAVEPGVHIYVEDVNPEGKKTIFFIHGWPANSAMFEYQFNQFT